MYITKADQACYEEATAISEHDNQILLGLYDDVEERYFALIAVVEEQNGKKKVYKSIDGLFLDSNSPALLKVFETEMINYLKLKKVNHLTTTINNDVDIKTCGLKYSNKELKEITIYASSIFKYFK